MLSEPQSALLDCSTESVERKQVRLARCLARHFDRIRMIVAARLGSTSRRSADIDDILQDVIVEALNQGDTFHYRGEKQFIKWISTISHRMVALSIRRGGRVRPSISIQNAAPGPSIVRPSRVPGRAPTPSNVMSIHERRSRLVAVLSLLPRKHRRVIRLILLEERTVAEAAVALRCSPNAVSKRFARALECLRTEMSIHHVNNC